MPYPRVATGLYFEVIAFYVGVGTIVIEYRNQTGASVCEVPTFDGPLVVEGHGACRVDGADALHTVTA